MLRPCLICYKQSKVVVGVVLRKEKATAKRFFQLFGRYLGKNGGGHGGGGALLEKLIDAGMLPCADCSKVVGDFCELYHEMKRIGLFLDWKVRSLEDGMANANNGRKVPATVKDFKDSIKELGMSGGPARFGDELIDAIFRFRRELIENWVPKLRRDVPRLILQKYQEPQEMGAGSKTTLSTAISEEETATPRLRRVHRCSKCIRTFSNPTKLEEHQRFHDEEDADRASEDVVDDNDEYHQDATGGGEDDYCDDDNGVDPDWDYEVKKELEADESYNKRRNPSPVAASASHSPDESPCSNNSEQGDEHRGSEHLEDSDMDSLKSTGHGQTTSTSLKTSAMMKAKDKKETFLCETCGRTFIRKASLVEHCKLKRCVVARQPVNYRCSMCDRGFGRIQHLNDHIQLMHPVKSPPVISSKHQGRQASPSKNPNAAPVTNASLLIDKEGDDNNAEQRGKAVMRIDPQTGLISCNLCPKEFQTEGGFRGHYKTKHLHRLYKCNICGKEFKQRATRWKHNRIVHLGIRPRFKCDKCGKDYSEKGTLTEHLRTSVCGLDGGSSKSGRVMETHKCQVCRKEFKREQDLRMHVKVGHEDGSFEHKCSKCGKGFTVKRQLSRHQRRHCDKGKGFEEEEEEPEGESAIEEGAKNKPIDDSVEHSSAPSIEQQEIYMQWS